MLSFAETVKANENEANNAPNANSAGFSSFELAMVRNRGGSAQRLINSDTESIARSVASHSSKKPRGTIDR